jgi:hypothetical protein
MDNRERPVSIQQSRNRNPSSVTARFAKREDFVTGRVELPRTSAHLPGAAHRKQDRPTLLRAFWEQVDLFPL